MKTRTRAVTTSIVVVASLAMVLPAANAATVGRSPADSAARPVVPDYLAPAITRSEYAAIMLKLPDMQGLASRINEMRAAAKAALQAARKTSTPLSSVERDLREAWLTVRSVNSKNIHYADPFVNRVQISAAEILRQSDLAVTSAQQMRKHAQALLAEAAEARADAEALLRNPQANRATRAAARDALVVVGVTINEAHDFLRAAEDPIRYLVNAHRNSRQGAQLAQEFATRAIDIIALVDQGRTGWTLERARKLALDSLWVANSRLEASGPDLRRAVAALEAFTSL